MGCGSSKLLPEESIVNKGDKPEPREIDDVQDERKNHVSSELEQAASPGKAEAKGEGKESVSDLEEDKIETPAMEVLEDEQEEQPDDESCDEKLFAKDVPEAVSSIRGTSLTHIGAGDPPRKSENQDVVFFHTSFGADNSMCIIGCMDGHGVHGKRIAELVGEFFEQNIVQRVNEARPNSEEDWDSLLKELFQDCERAIAENEDVGFRNRMSGATATLAILQNGVLHTANVGDSKLVAFSGPPGGSWVSHMLTTDHRPDFPEERERIEASGGVVMSRDLRKDDTTLPLRVYLSEEKRKSLGFKDPVPGLMLTRSIGDTISKLAGCTCEPDVSHRNVGSDVALVAASDGVWDMLTDEQVAMVLQENETLPPADVAVILRDRALERWDERRMADNIGIVLVYL